MLKVPSFAVVRRIGLFLADSGYNANYIADQLNLSETLRADRSNLAVLLAKTEGESVLSMLARLLFVGWPVSSELCRRLLPEQFLTSAFDSGLLAVNGDVFEAQAALVPFEQFLIACDSPRLTAGHSDMVVGPGRSTLVIAQAAIGGQNETTLDIGSGTGILSIAAAAHSREVIGTDVSPRAHAFAEFNAAFNGVTNVKFLCGDGLEPVQGRVFTRILANPPFFLNPSKTYTFCDSPLALDGFSRRLAKESPAYLAEGGYFQMVTEWVQIKGQPWQERIKEWVANSGCDTFVNLGPVLAGPVYAEKRFGDAKALFGERNDESFAQHLEYFAENQVENVVLGIITMRKRRGQNWFAVLDSLPMGLRMSEAINERFTTLTYALSHSPEQMLGGRFRVSPDAVLDQRVVLREEGWLIDSIELRKTGPFEDRLRLDAAVMQAVQRLDGKTTLDEIALSLAQESPITVDQARQQCVQLCQRLLQTSFIQPIK